MEEEEEEEEEVVVPQFDREQLIEKYHVSFSIFTFALLLLLFYT